MTHEKAALAVYLYISEHTLKRYVPERIQNEVQGDQHQLGLTCGSRCDPGTLVDPECMSYQIYKFARKLKTNCGKRGVADVF